MASKFFKGKTVQDVLESDLLDFMSWGKPQLREAVSKLASAANKRLKRLQSAGLQSPALYEVAQSGGKFSTRNKTEGELRTEFLRAQQFLENPYSTVKEARQVMKETERRLASRNFSISQPTYNKLLSGYLDQRSKNPAIAERTLKYMLMRETEIVYPSEWSVERAAQIMSSEFEQQYQPGGSQYGGVAEFFEIEPDI